MNFGREDVPPPPTSLEDAIEEIQYLYGVLYRERRQFGTILVEKESRLGVFRDACQEAREALLGCLAHLDAVAPQPGHCGSCGPEAGCDLECMAAAGHADVTYPARVAVARLRRILMKKPLRARGDTGE